MNINSINKNKTKNRNNINSVAETATSTKTIRLASREKMTKQTDSEETDCEKRA